MELNLKDLLRIPSDRNGTGVRSYMEGDAIVIDCRGCDVRPMPGSDECMGCIVGRMAETGISDRIILRTGIDTEISDSSGRVLRDVSALRRWSMPREPPKGRCSGCDASRYRVMERAWATFPEDGIPFARGMLEGKDRSLKECGRCRESTGRALDLLEERLEKIIDSMVVG